MKEIVEPDKNGKYHYTYKITNKINMRYYIGIHTAPTLNNAYLGSGIAIRFAIKKYGIENFEKEILSVFPTRKEANEDERERIGNLFDTDPLCYNLRGGGENYVSMSKESKQKISNTLKGRNKHNNYAVAKMAHTKAGRTKFDNESVRKMSETKKGRTKETSDVVRRQAETLRNRSKDNYEYLKHHSNVMKGRTKENNEGMRKMSSKLSGRSKETHEYIILASIKKSNGLYVTPELTYASSGDLKKSTGCSPRVCVHNSRVFTQVSLKRCKSWLLKCLKNEIGKTYKELGFYFIKFHHDVDRVEFCRQHGIGV